MTNGIFIIWSKYCDYYINNFESLINCIKRMFRDQDEPCE